MITARRASFLLAVMLTPALLSLTAEQSGAAAVGSAPGPDALVTLEGSRPALSPAVKKSAASADGSTVLHMRVVFARSAAQQAALERFESDLLTKGTAEYKKWMTPGQFGTTYGASDADVEAVARLQGRGSGAGPHRSLLQRYGAAG
jgi:hypothetical protein